MNKKILICEDDIGVAQLLKSVLEDSDFEVALLSNGKGIQKQITKSQPNLILLDLWMPGMDGKEVTKLLKQNPQTRDIPIIIVSALNDTEKISQEIGADDFISKPFDILDLIKIVNKYTKT